MIRSTKLMTAIVLAMSPAIQAQDSIFPYLRHETVQVQWQQVGANMSPGKYEEAVQHNRRLAQDRIEHTILSLGVPKLGLDLVGAAAALAVDDVKLPLNKSKTLALKIDDAANEDRSAIIQMKFEW